MLSQSFDRGFYLLVKAIQELRERKDGLVVTVGIGGPTGSGKTRCGGGACYPFDRTVSRKKGLINTSQLGGEGGVGPRVRRDRLHGGLPHGGRQRRRQRC
jgi:hypothetical protein